MQNNYFYNKNIIHPLALFISCLVAYWLGYFFPLPQQFARLDFAPQSGLSGALAFIVFFGLFITAFQIIYAINILARKRSTLFISIFGSSYPISMYVIMLAAIVMAFGFGLHHAGINGSNFKLYLANICCGLFLYFTFSGFIILVIDYTGHLMKRNTR